MKNLLIGAISANYKVEDIFNWVATSKWSDCDRVLLFYNVHDQFKNDILTINQDLEELLKLQDVKIVKPNFDFWGNDKEFYNCDTGKCDFFTSYDLIHNIRFLHIWNYLEGTSYDKVLITDVRDVYFNRDPFSIIPKDGIVATSEEIFYQNENWNKEHLHYNLGLIGLESLLDKHVYNVGVFGGGKDLVRQICSDIYLLSIGKYKVADQTSFNYLIQTKYKDQVTFTGIKDMFAVHLHVINAGLVPFDLNTIDQYTIVHQYDRIKK
jgi:hypothetical protein